MSECYYKNMTMSNVKFCCKKTRHGTERKLRSASYSPPFPLTNWHLTSMSPFADIPKCRRSLTFWIVADR